MVRITLIVLELPEVKWEERREAHEQQQAQ